MELWDVPAPYGPTVQSLREQLPTFSDYEGLEWCGEEVNETLTFTSWAWAGTSELLTVVVQQEGSVLISRGPEPNARNLCE